MKKDFLLLLKSSGLKITPARLEILNVFSLDCHPIDAEYIGKHLKNKKINQVTIYRNLASLEKEGIIRRVNLQQEAVNYELADHHHHHFICTVCGQTESFAGCDISSLITSVLKKSTKFKKINYHSLELFGLCKKCAQG